MAQTSIAQKQPIAGAIAGEARGRGKADLVIEDPLAAPVAAIAVGQALGGSHQAPYILPGPQVQVSAAALGHRHPKRGPGKGLLPGAPPSGPRPQASQQPRLSLVS